MDRKQEKKFAREEIGLYSFKDKNGTHAVHYSNHNRPKLMMVHGYGASGIGQYFRSAIDLNESYDLILPDLLYCGKSSGNGVDFSVEAQVQHLKTIFDTLHIDEPVVLIGNSYGGIISAYFAEQYPALVKRLVVYDSPINYYTSTYADSLAISLDVPSVKELLSPTTIYENRVSLDLIFRNQPYIPKFLRRQMIKYGSIPSRPSQLQLLDHLLINEHELNTHYFKWKMPVNVCWGEYDVLIPMNTCRSIMKRYQMKEQQLHIFPNAAHAANVEFPDEFVHYVKTLMD